MSAPFLRKPLVRDDIGALRPHALANPADPVGLLPTALWVMNAEGIPSSKPMPPDEIPPPDGAGRTWALLHCLPGAYHAKTPTSGDDE